MEHQEAARLNYTSSETIYLFDCTVKNLVKVICCFAPSFVYLVVRPKPNTFSYPYFITHTSLLFEFSIEKKYSRLAGKILEVRSTRIFPENAVETQGKYFSGGSTAFSGGLHIYYGNQIAEF